MSCNLGLQHAWHGFGHEHGLTDPALRLQSRGSGLQLTDLKRWHTRTNQASRYQRWASTGISAPSSTDGRGTLADALVGSVTQTLALGLSAASTANDSLARLQRVVGPLPSGFPPGKVSPHAKCGTFMPYDHQHMTHDSGACDDPHVLIRALQGQAQTWQLTS